MDVNVITLEDGKEYIIYSIVENANNRYFVLLNEEDEQYCFRKVIKTENNETALVKLASNEEYEQVLSLFNKHEKGEKNE